MLNALRTHSTKILWAVVLVVAAIAAVTLWNLQAHRPPSRAQLKKKLPALGEIVVLQGQARSRFAQSPEFAPLKDERLVQAESIETSDKSEVEIDLDNGAVVVIHPNSRTLFENLSRSVRVTVLAGSVEIKKQEPSSAVEIVDLNHLPAPVIVEKKISGTLVVPTQASDDSHHPHLQDLEGEPKATSDVKTLSQDEILRSLQAQNPLFRKCYVGLRERTPGQEKIEMLISFYIQPTGKLTDARIWHTSVKDETFLKCVSEVFERAHFRNFQGDTVRVDEFPLSFE